MSDDKRSSATVIGIVDEVGEVKSFGEKGFQKREVVIKSEPDSKYPQLVAVTFAGKNLDKAAELNVGDEVVIDANLRGRRSNGGRVFTDIDAWRVKVTSGGAAPSPPFSGGTPAGPDDDIPFGTAAIGHEPSAMWRHFR